MNKRVAVLLTVLLVLFTAFSYKIYLNSKKELKTEYERSAKILDLASQIKALKQKNAKIPRFCIKKDKIYCENMDRFKFYRFQRFLQKADIKEFEIKKDKNVNAYVKIEK